MTFKSALGLLACFAAPSALATDWMESSQGDLSTDPNHPTAIALTLGSNFITGSVTGGTDTRDYITFTLPAGFELEHLIIVAYDDGAGGLGNTGFNAINAGATSFIPSSSTANNFLAGAHVESSLVGADMLTIFADPLQRTNGTGLTVPVPAGTYSYDIQQTSSGAVSAYELDFQMAAVPEPLTVGSLGLLGLFAIRRR